MAKKESAILDAPANELPLHPSEMTVEPKSESCSLGDKPAAPISIAKRLEDFLIDLGTDPEAKILGLDQFGKPSKYDQFREFPLNRQRVVTLRVLIVDEPRE